MLFHKMILHSSEVKFHAQQYINYETLRLLILVGKMAAKKSIKKWQGNKQFGRFSCIKCFKNKWT